ncbi:dienelactone hydrolase family protein [Pacificimonas flava]|uniref:Dienelactone hydrolase family protein n=1 Tax=Pacificimonas flava TaxID=1234595 RepID=M2TL35_9SPHN|nr:dienelactone hydrolase family protein [Pacificimonas flava]EMD82356.1 dienelactone hydrolase family protein [Pacificimonas flava]MBB5280738.1 dienelactone hydrolase [Pacificimonas flava]
MTKRREFEIETDGITLRSLLVTPEGEAPFAAVLIFPQWSGRSPSEETFAERLAALGYAAIACDLYGDARRGRDTAENEALMTPLTDDRARLRTRLEATLAAARDLDEVDADRIATAGFCFGGLCAIDLARSGADIRACASFHGLLSAPEGLDEREIRATVAVYHGWADPMAPPDHVVALGEELTRRKADWYLTGYGHAVHAFTREDADDRDSGIAYDAHADRRSWRDFTGLLEEALA